jgi:hypothetical protein
MNWEESKALTHLKKDFLLTFYSENQDFFVSGGTALGVFYLDHRRSYDIDLFTLEAKEWHRIENQLRAVAEAIGASVEFISRSPEFVRCKLERSQEFELLDLVVERVPQIDSEKNRFGAIRVDTLHEIGVNKICTLVSRGEQKDIIDLYFLKKHGFDVFEHFSEAQRKEGGLDPAIISYLLSEIRIDSVPEYMLIETSVDDLNAFVDYLAGGMAELAFPE